MLFKQSSFNSKKYFFLISMSFFLVFPLFFDGLGVYKNADQSGLGIPISILFSIFFPVIIFLKLPVKATIVFIFVLSSWLLSYCLHILFEGASLTFILLSAYVVPLMSGYVFFVILRASRNFDAGL